MATITNNESGPIVAITVEYTVADVVHAARWVQLRTVRQYVGIAIIVVMVVAASVFYVAAGEMQLAISFIILAGVVPFLVLGLNLLMVTQMARKNLESDPSFQHPFTWAISPTSLHIKGKGVAATRELVSIVRAVETEHGFLLWQSARFYNYLPKHALRSKEQLEAVRECIRSGLPGTAKVKLRND